MRAMQERNRVAALKSYGILDTPNEPEFDRLVRNIAARFRVPRALISFIDERRQWYKARIGVAATHVPRAISFCTHSILSDRVTVTLDARLDTRFNRNPFVLEEDGIRFYAAAPIKTASHARIGTVCIFDNASHADFTARDETRLARFADEVVALLDKRRAQRLEPRHV